MPLDVLFMLGRLCLQEEVFPFFGFLNIQAEHTNEDMFCKFSAVFVNPIFSEMCVKEAIHLKLCYLNENLIK